MSNLNEFKSSDDFRQQLKKFLLKERNIGTQNQNCAPVVNTKRHSFEINADLKKTIDEKLGESGKSLRLETTREHINNTNMAECNDVAGEGDESFMALEMMCNKTASDPESTLFTYMNSDCRQHVLENVKQRQSKEREEVEQGEREGDIDEFHGFNVQMLNNNETQLADIEEPSKFWEQTLLGGNSVLATSPVKMMALLRPSTIMEERDDDYSHDASVSASATSGAETMSNYETAADTTSSTQAKSEMPFYSMRNSLESVTSNIKCEQPEEEEDDEDTSPTKSVSTVKAAVDLCTTLPDDSVIEIVSDEESTNTASDDQTYDNNAISNLINLSSGTYAIANDNHSTDDDDKENCATDDKKNTSREFNDTLEEVEYMMKRGMEFMAVEAKQQQQQQAAEESELKQAHSMKINKVLKVNTAPNRHASPQMVKSSPQKTPLMNKFKVKPNDFSPSKVASTPPFVIKPIPKFEMFKRPMPGSASKFNATPTSAQSLRKAKQFEHIVSPIGMYVKNTANRPLITNVHSKTDERNLKDTTVFRNLEKMNFLDSQAAGSSTSSSTFVAPSGILPKKAYISSKYKHMVDERTQFTVPGGNSIQQYIQPALVPAVVRHDGKMHLNPMTSKIPKPENCVDESLKDLSIMSGDISLLTIKDARKF